MPITSTQTQVTMLLEKKIINMNIDVEARRIDYIIRYHTTVTGVVMSSMCHRLGIDGSLFIELASKLPISLEKSMYDNIAELSYAFIEEKGLWPA